LRVGVVGFVVIPEQLDVMIDYAMHEIFNKRPKRNAEDEDNQPLDNLFRVPVESEE
jgi:hypothetical protein